MVARKKGLGRGLDALLGNKRPTAPMSDGSVAVAETLDGELRDLPLDIIQRGKYQPRLDMRTEALEDLANSIKAQGVVQPIVVRPIGNNR
ncbi:MAG: ParB N-terminal domain-containing protein, partial [Gammaproteobacteria bacterium]|nr:ParB N-terminal domain-containing protein [Gammaproteobacteria bacterium]